VGRWGSREVGKWGSGEVGRWGEKGNRLFPWSRKAIFFRKNR